MIELQAPFRPARQSDIWQLAELVNFAGEGLPLHIWRGMAKPDQDPWEVGRSRQAEKVSGGQIYVADFGDGAVAALTGYPIGAQAEPIGDDFPPLFRPLQELENLALNSWYVNVLACYPEHRGRGLGSRLLQLAEDIAQDGALASMSVIVADDNVSARRLYERTGYREIASLPCVREDWDTETENWVLLTKAL
ncbi:GNAT family N-acetyltransferase [Nitratireductor indicus]|uniref:GNAT family N-acetyltransferase n=1 Tax=Nitratireductor indicus TaxID=721133 RepID=UPI0028770A61|nr:GNAT family N-acetyltransferase [Nitratireductor indicus]MDS1137327.1 GNAT family N-acetyltransferase [Nitratireductor indicus]